MSVQIVEAELDRLGTCGPTDWPRHTGPTSKRSSDHDPALQPKLALAASLIEVGTSPPGSRRAGGPAADAPDGRPLPGAGLAAADRGASKPVQVAFARAIEGPFRGRRIWQAKRTGARAAAARFHRDRMISSRLRFESSRATEFVDLTKRLRDELQKSGLRNGRIHMQSLHTTVGLAINENEPFSLGISRHSSSALRRVTPDTSMTTSRGDTRSRPTSL